MTDPIPFGAHVHVRATVEPRYLRWVTERRKHIDGFVLSFDTDTEPVDPPALADDSAIPKGPIGDPLPGSPDVPDNGVHRRLRRLDADTTGVVVGSVLRKEGRYIEGGSGFDEPAFLSPAHTVRLVQVACEPDGPRGPARIVLAHPDDVETKDDR